MGRTSRSQVTTQQGLLVLKAGGFAYRTIYRGHHSSPQSRRIYSSINTSTITKHGSMWHHPSFPPACALPRASMETNRRTHKVCTSAHLETRLGRRNDRHDDARDQPTHLPLHGRVGRGLRLRRILLGRCLCGRCLRGRCLLGGSLRHGLPSTRTNTN